MAVATEQRSINATSLAVRPDQPLIGIVLIEDGQEITRYFIDEAEADAVVATRTATDVRGRLWRLNRGRHLRGADLFPRGRILSGPALLFHEWRTPLCGGAKRFLGIHDDRDNHRSRGR